MATYEELCKRMYKDIISLEKTRQEEEVCLIASENYTYKDVMEAQGSCLTNKYAEGYPDHRYYGGCKYVDMAEKMAIDNCKNLFKCKYANVQPHSGSQANQAVYAALLNPGDTVLAMDLNSGAHITHVSKASYTSKIYKPVYYGLDKNGYINYDEIKEKLNKYHPKLLIVGASAYSREIDFQRIRTILDEYNKNKHTCVLEEHTDVESRETTTWKRIIEPCYFMVDMAHIAGLVAAGEHMSPVPYADVVTSTSQKTLRGPRGGFIITNDEEIAKKVDRAVFPQTQGGPLMHVILGKAIAFDRASVPSFKRYIRRVKNNIKAMEDVFEQYGLGMVSGGSDNHLILIDLTKTNASVSGKDVEESLGKVGIIVNKNAVPNDKRPKSETSGIRIGTAAITTRGFTEEECEELAKIIYFHCSGDVSDKEIIKQTKRVREMCKAHPIETAKDLQ